MRIAGLLFFVLTLSAFGADNSSNTTENRPELSPFKMGLSATAFSRDRNPIGGLLSLSWYPSRVLGFTAFGGAQYDNNQLASNPYAGLDLEFRPFRLPVTETYDLFQFGFLAGATTLGGYHGNSGSLHLGARVDINLGSTFGITAATRFNLDYAMFEAGIVTRL